MAAMHVEKSLDKMCAQMDAGVKSGLDRGLAQSFQGHPLTAGQKEAVEQFKNKLTGMLKDEFSFAKMKDYYLQAYRETLTQDDVNNLIAFYTSPSGRAVVDKIPLAMDKAGTQMQGRIGPLIQKLQAMEEEFATELAKTK